MLAKRSTVPMCVCVCVEKKVKGQECGKGHETSQALLRQRGAGSRLSSTDSVRCQVHHLSWTEPSASLDWCSGTLGIHKRGRSCEGQPSGFSDIPKNGRPSYLWGSWMCSEQRRNRRTKGFLSTGASENIEFYNQKQKYKEENLNSSPGSD